jgi:hypothetical protein
VPRIAAASGSFPNDSFKEYVGGGWAVRVWDGDVPLPNSTDQSALSTVTG